MTQLLKAIWNFLCQTGKAKYAANLARNGKIEEAKAVYQK